jgi:flagellar biosynthesis anti-sigma factor FlgM
MKIQNDGTTGLLDTLTKTGQVKSSKDTGTDATTTETTTDTDTVELSSRKAEVEKLTARAMAAPDVRQDKVDKVSAAIANQTYNVKGELVARSMMKSQLLDEVL